MKVSLNWLRDYLEIHKTPPEIADILTSLGLEVEGWEAVKPSAVDLDKVVTALVTACDRIPDTDHLSATLVDVGDGIARSIVCGAPNVAVGQKVFVALPGAQVFSKDGSLFTIAERKVRGVASQGMICAQDELGVGHDHSGIMVLADDTALGITAAIWFKQEADTIFEIGLTPNRADATSHLGVAKDILAWLRVHETPNAQLHNIDLEGIESIPQGVASLPVTVENTEACPRYAGLTISGITVGESPEWLKNRLLAVGQRPINNVVDVTNYVRIELGQPLHAFDLTAIQGGGIIVKNLPEGTIFKTLDGVERKLYAEDLMICDAANHPLCLAGVFGGADSGVKDSTTAIFLESAVFHPRAIRRSMIRHNLRTDAAWVFEKGVDAHQTVLALQRAAVLIARLTGGKISSEVVDIHAALPVAARVPVFYQRINALIGETLSIEKIHHILDALAIGREDETAAGFTAIITTNKPDVTREADVVEEILRVYGLDNVPIPTQIRSSMEVTQRPHPDSVRNMAADFLAANGFNEAMSLSLANSAYHLGETALLPIPQENLVFIHNTANQGLDCLRASLLFSGLEAVVRNQNRQNPDLRLFEFGKTYARFAKQDQSPGFVETLRLSMLMTGTYAGETWQPVNKRSVDFYTLKSYVQNLLTRLGVSGFQETALADAPFQSALRFHRGPQELVTFGAVQPAILKKMDIKNPVFFADFNFELVFKAATAHKIQFAELNRFPTVRRDLALVINQAVTFGEIRQLATKTVKKMLKDVNLFDVFEDESKLGAGKKSYAVSFTFEDSEKTLQDKEIDAAMQQLQQAFETKLNALIRK